jgi:hypothetical protein
MTRINLILGEISLICFNLKSEPSAHLVLSQANSHTLIRFARPYFSNKEFFIGISLSHLLRATLTLKQG